MEIALFSSAWLAFSLSPSLAPLTLRGGLAACLRFSPRAALALSGLAALWGCLGALAARGGLHAVPPGQRLPIVIAGITGGAIGNLIDRAATGQVIDMICIPWFSTFNVADLFITFGAGILVLYILIKDKEFLADSPKKDKEKQNDADAG